MKSNPESESIIRKKFNQTIGDQIRKIADDLKQEQSIQIKATSRILGAAAQMAENHDKLIDEVTDMINEDLEQQDQSSDTNVYTINNLKQQYKTLKKAKAYFGIKANSWATLVNKLNNPTTLEKEKDNDSLSSIEISIEKRLITVEEQIKNISNDIQEILLIVKQILKKQSN